MKCPGCGWMMRVVGQGIYQCRSCGLIVDTWLTAPREREVYDDDVLQR